MNEAAIDIGKRPDQRPAGHNDWFILLGVLGLMFFSIAFVYSASAGFSDEKTGSSATFFWSHAIRVLAGIAVMFGVSRMDYHWLERWSKPMLILALGMLLYVLFDGTKMKGATRWLSLGPISFQPSEFAKFALVMHLGVMLAEKRRYLDDFKRSFMPMMFWVALACGLVALQPNLSTAAVIFMVAMGTLLVGRVNLKQFVGVFALGLVLVAGYAVSAPYRMKRIMTYVSMHDNVADTLNASNYQLTQGLIAFGSGGITGVGPGQSRQRLFVPEPFGDFIYSIIGEEYGFIGTLAILAVFGLILWRGLLVARHAPDDLGRNVAAGITLIIGAYAVINACVTTGLVPTTGLPMPFVSYGGSSVLFSAAAVGVLLNISRQANVMPMIPAGRVGAVA
ncbi:MAG: putative lipid II flippase FtsW [Bacteroidetes bacterium]|nr:putative lipid II flippase FtsW [Bacteroidota bacterium]